jgi:hypothetical protein
MKRLQFRGLALLLVLLPVIGFAQEEEPLPAIAVLPITGTNLEDAEPLYESLIQEVNAYGKYRAVRTSTTDATAEFTLTSTLIEEIDDILLQLTLWRTKTNEVLVSQEMVYGNLDDALGLMPLLVQTLLDNIPVIVPPEEDFWRDRWLHLALRGGAAPRLYYSEDSPGNTPISIGLTFETALSVGVPVWKYLTIQAEAVFTMDSVSAKDYLLVQRNPGDPGYAEFGPIGWSSQNIRFTTFNLSFPLILKTHILHGTLMVSPFIGAALTATVNPVTNNYKKESDGEVLVEEKLNYSMEIPVGLIAGVYLGMKLGPGALFMDLRFNTDIGRITVEPPTDPQDVGMSFRRFGITFSLGYEFGFLPKEKPEPGPEEFPGNVNEAQGGMW